MASTTNELVEKPRDPTDLNGSTDASSDNPMPSDTPEEGPNAPEAPGTSKGKLALVLVALCLAVFLAAIDAVLITPALPTIVRDFGASDAGYSWIGSSYLLALAASSPVWSKVSDIFGRKPILLLANFIFLIGSLIAALSYNPTMLIAGRAVQGVGGGGIITLVEISVGDMFSQRFGAF